jgi:hypothetical protein
MKGAAMRNLEFTQHIYQEKKNQRYEFDLRYGTLQMSTNRRTRQNNIQHLQKMLILFQTDILIFKLEI